MFLAVSQALALAFELNKSVLSLRQTSALLFNVCCPLADASILQAWFSDIVFPYLCLGQFPERLRLCHQLPQTGYRIPQRPVYGRCGPQVIPSGGGEHLRSGAQWEVFRS